MGDDRDAENKSGRSPSSRVAELEQRVAAQQAELERLQAANPAFVAKVAHDFRTPLGGIKLFAELLLSHADDLDECSRSDYLAVIGAEADKLNRMLAIAQDFQAISTGRFEWHEQQVDLVQLLRRALRPLEVSCRAKQLKLSCTVQPEQLSAIIDQERFTLMVHSLVAAAIKVVEDGGIEVGLRKYVDAEGRERVCVSVSYPGAGTADEQLRQKVSHPAREVVMDGDVDMGLYLCNYIVSHYGGGFWSESGAGGTVYHVDMPLQSVD